MLLYYINSVGLFARISEGEDFAVVCYCDFVIVRDTDDTQPGHRNAVAVASVRANMVIGGAAHLC